MLPSPLRPSPATGCRTPAAFVGIHLGDQRLTNTWARRASSLSMTARSWQTAARWAVITSSGGGVGLDLPAGVRPRLRWISAACTRAWSRRARRGGGAGGRRRGQRGAAAAASFTAVGVLQVDHVDVAAAPPGVGWSSRSISERRHLRRRWAGRAHHQGVAARIGDHTCGRSCPPGPGRRPKPVWGCSRRVTSTARSLATRRGSGITRRHRWRCHVHGRDDAAQALQVVGVVGVMTSVVAWVDVDRVVRADHMQHRAPGWRRLMVEREDASPPGCPGCAAGRHAHPCWPAGLASASGDSGDAEASTTHSRAAQRGGELLEGQRRRDPVAGQVHGCRAPADRPPRHGR